jgi:LPXTG-motif cell wall-anchored protein
VCSSDLTFDERTASENTTPTTKANYLTYTDGISTVWIKDPNTTIPGTGDTSAWLLIGVLAIALLGAVATVFALRRRRQLV